MTQQRVTPEERAAYLDTEVCRRYGHVPVGWRFQLHHDRLSRSGELDR